MLDPDTFETASRKREVGTNWNTAPAVDSGRGPRAVSGKPTPSRNILQTQNARRFAGISTESKESVGCRFWVTAKERWPTGAGIQLYQTVEPVVPEITLDACSEKETTSREWNWAQRWLDTDWARKKWGIRGPKATQTEMEDVSYQVIDGTPGLRFRWGKLSTAINGHQCIVSSPMASRTRCRLKPGTWIDYIINWGIGVCNYVCCVSVPDWPQALLS